jgi:hypothetical protein
MENIEDVFGIDNNDNKIEIMSSSKYLSKTKELLGKIEKEYSIAWQDRPLKDNEMPNEIICDRCDGCGVFLENGQEGEERDCFQDREQGECYHRYCDYEQVGLEIESLIGCIHELLRVEKLD